MPVKTHRMKVKGWKGYDRKRETKGSQQQLCLLYQQSRLKFKHCKRRRRWSVRKEKARDSTRRCNNYKRIHSQNWSTQSHKANLLRSKHRDQFQSYLGASPPALSTMDKSSGPKKKKTAVLVRQMFITKKHWTLRPGNLSVTPRTHRGRKESSPRSSPLTSIHILWYEDNLTHTHTAYINIK